MLGRLGPKTLYILFFSAMLTLDKRFNYRRKLNMIVWCVFSLFVKKVMEKAMALHSSTLAWKIPWMEEPDRLQSMELLRVGHD